MQRGLCARGKLQLKAKLITAIGHCAKVVFILVPFKHIGGGIRIIGVFQYNGGIICNGTVIYQHTVQIILSRFGCFFYYYFAPRCRQQTHLRIIIFTIDGILYHRQRRQVICTCFIKLISKVSFTVGNPYWCSISELKDSVIIRLYRIYISTGDIYQFRLL